MVLIILTIIFIILIAMWMFKPFKNIYVARDGYHENIEKATMDNVNYRKVEYTTPNMQLVLMNLKAGQEIGTETHATTTQFIRVEEGTGRAIINKKEYPMKGGDAFIVPPGTEHNFISTTPLKLYTIYSPPEHPDGLIQPVQP